MFQLQPHPTHEELQYVPCLSLLHVLLKASSDHNGSYDLFVGKGSESSLPEIPIWGHLVVVDTPEASLDRYLLRTRRSRR